MFDFHRDLLADEVRVNAYREAIGKTVRPGDVVLDVGTGTGILAFFACQAGARRVYAVERQHSADAAAMLARQLGFADRITVIHGRAEQVELPEPADVLVTDTVGPLVFNEGILAAVAGARRWMAPGARFIPSRVDVWTAPVEIPDFYEETLDWWSEPRYGFDLSQLRLFAANTVSGLDMPPEALLAPIAVAESIDCSRIDGTLRSGAASFRAARAGTVHAFAIGFYATLAEGVTLSNAWSRATTWHRGVLPLEKAVKVEAGTPMEMAFRTDNGSRWEWSGSIGGETFDQTTLMSRPPCIAR